MNEAIPPAIKPRNVTVVFHGGKGRLSGDWDSQLPAVGMPAQHEMPWKRTDEIFGVGIV
jgi:hypothetical protein